jgi:pimeloyl-ACP methyl ester carboxylesterase
MKAPNSIPLRTGLSTMTRIWWATCIMGMLAFTSCTRMMVEPGLNRAAAEKALQTEWQARLVQLQTGRAAELEKKVIEHQGKFLRWEEKVFGDAPTNGRSLWISMHGGGNAPKQVNDSQWRNQIGLYKPDEGIYIAPRAPTDTWNLWHEAHIDPMFDRLIEDYVVLRGVNPDRVYILGYSAGGDGVWQLAPRMADRWAAAAMMAGHPNEASLLGLRNLPFAIFMGGNDAAYSRNKIAADRAEKLAELQKADSGGYEHFVRIYPGLPHWMNRKDAEALPWMAKHTRNVWPKKIVWLQDDVTHPRFYWLAVPPAEAKRKRQINAEVDGQVIRLTGDVPQGMTLRLSDALVNLDKPVRVLVTNREVFHARSPRRVEVIRASLQERADPRSAATAEVKLNWE